MFKKIALLLVMVILLSSCGTKEASPLTGFEVLSTKEATSFVVENKDKILEWINGQMPADNIVIHESYRFDKDERSAQYFVYSINDEFEGYIKVFKRLGEIQYYPLERLERGYYTLENDYMKVPELDSQDISLEFNLQKDLNQLIKDKKVKALTE